MGEFFNSPIRNKNTRAYMEAVLRFSAFHALAGE